MNKKILFKISEIDESMFSDMNGHYQSDTEKKFFVELKRKEQTEPAYSNELLIFEKENSDGIYLLRKYYDIYLLGYRKKCGSTEEFECESLYNILHSNLGQCVDFPESITLLEWLRRQDYSVIRYNRNYDND